jgi:hypothetical protein
MSTDTVAPSTETRSADHRPEAFQPALCPVMTRTMKAPTG